MDVAALQEKRGSVAFLSLLALQRYFLYMRKTFYPLSFRVFCCIQVIQSLQIVTLLIPRDSGKGLPWSYSLCGWMWTSLELTVRPEALMLHLGASEVTVTIVLSVLLVGKILLGLGLAGFLAMLKEETFESLQENSDKKLWFRALLNLDYYWRLLLFRVLNIPLPAYFLTHLPFSQGLPFLLLLFPVLTALDIAYFSSTSWFTNDYEAVSAPIVPLNIWLMDFIFIFFVTLFDFDSYSVKFACILIALGGYKVLILVRTAPFHRFSRSVIEIFKGVMVGWGGVCMLIGEEMEISQGSILPVSLFVVITPLLTGIFAHVLHLRMHTLCNVQYPQRLYEIEQILRKQIFKSHSTSQKADTAFKRACTLFPKSEQLVIWALYYYKSLKDVTFVQVNVSKLMKIKWGVVSYIECFTCYKGVISWLKTIQDQAEPLSFWEYQVRLEEILRRDNEITKIHYELFSELALEHPKSQKIAKLSRILVTKMTTFEAYVKRTMQKHPICPELLRLYSNFLSILTNSRRAAKYEQLAFRVTEQLKTNKAENCVDLYDPECMIVVMSIEPSTLGSIIWAKNSRVLGYLSPADVMGIDHNIIIPLPLKRSHAGMLKRITVFRHHHPVYESRHHLYFEHQTGALVGAHWKVRLINLPFTGDMTIVAALKPREDAAVIAFVDDSGRKVTAMVWDRQTHRFRECITKVIGQECPLSFDLAVVFGENNGQWEDQKVFWKGKRDTGMWVIKGEIFRIFDIYPQKILKIYQDYGTSARNSLRPLYEGGDLIKSSLSVPPNQPEITKTAAISALFPTLSRHTRDQTLVSSIIESRTSLSIPKRENNKEDPWSAVYQRVKFQRETLNKVPKWLDLAVLATLILALSVLLGLYMTTEGVKQHMISRVMELHIRRELAVKASIYARQIAKMQLFPNTTAELDSLVKELKTQITTLQETADSDSAYRTANYEENGIWWEFTDDHFEEYMLNSLDLLRKLVSHTEQVAVHVNSSSSSSYLTVVRNGAAETLKTFNATMSRFLFALQTEEEDSSRYLPGLLALSVATIAALLLLVSYYVLKVTNSAQRSLWRILSKMPTSIYAAARAGSKLRLVDLHNADFLEMDINETGSHARHAANLPFTRLFEWKLLALSLTVCIIGVITGLVVIYTESRKDAVYYSAQVPWMLFYEGLREVTLLKLHFFTREFLFNPSVTSLWPTQQYFFDLQNDLQTALNRCKYYDWNLIYSRKQLKIEEIAHSSQEISLLMDFMDGATILKHGVHPGLNSLQYDLLLLPDLPLDFNLLETRFKSLISAVETIIELNMSQTRTQGDSQYFRYISLLITMAVSLLAFYVALIKPVLLVLIRKIVEEWRLLLFLPQEAGVHIYRLMNG